MLPAAGLIMIITDFDGIIAGRIKEHHRDLATRWFDRLLQLLPVGARDVFPSDTLLDHIPSLIVEISQCVHQPEENAISANTAILDKARELGSLRHGQRASLHQVLREYHILGAVLTTFVIEEIERLALTPLPGESAALILRLQQAVNVLSQATVETFVDLYTDTITEQSRRLEEFTRLAAHEWRQPLSTLQFGIVLLRHPDLDCERATRTWAAVDRNLAHLVDLTRKLESVARLHAQGDTPMVQVIGVSVVAREAARQLREMAEARNVQIIVQEDMPELTVDVGRLELTFINLLSNAIKYSDPDKDERVVEVTASSDQRAGWWRVSVRDNGIGIPPQALDTVFRRFTRAHADREDLARVAGIGLGLAIVDDCVRAMGGDLAVESAEGQGTTFTFTLPARAALFAPERSL